MRPFGIFLDSFVEVFFGCCFAVALGLDPPDPDAAARAGVLFFAVFGAEVFDVRLPFDAAADLFFFFLVICASFRVFLPGLFLVIFPKTQLSAFYGLYAISGSACSNMIRSRMSSMAPAMLE